MAGVAAARDPRPPGPRAPAVAALGLLAPLVVAVRGGAHGDAAVAVDPGRVALPVVGDGARGPASPRQHAPPASPDPSPAPPSSSPGSRPVLDVGPPPRAHHAREQRGPPAGVGAVGVQVAVVRRAGAGRRPAAAVVDRQLALARLVDHPGGHPAHQLGVIGAVHPPQGGVGTGRAAHRAHDPVAQEAAERAPVDPRDDERQRAQSDGRQAHQPDPLDRRLTPFAMHESEPDRDLQTARVTHVTNETRMCEISEIGHNGRRWTRPPRRSRPSSSAST